MRIVMLCRLYSPHIGGVERHVQGLSRELLKRGHKITIVTEQYSDELPLRETIEGVEVFRIPRLSSNNKQKVWVWMLENLQIFKDAELVQAHDVFWWYLPIRYIFLQKPVFTTFHGYENVEGPTTGAKFSRKISEFLSCKTLAIGGWMQKWYGQNPDLVSYGAANAQNSPVPKENTAVFVGRLDIDTGIMEYVQAMLLFAGKIKLDIYGEGILKTKLEKMIKNHKYIQLCGTTDASEAVFTSHRFVFASQYLSMLEAMQIGRQVFSFANNEFKKDYIESFPTSKNLIVFSDPNELKVKIESVLKDPKIEIENINSARSWTKTQNWKHLADVYESLWQK
jgi:glycosyltransferase involved in cell wall biosynthesis